MVSARVSVRLASITITIALAFAHLAAAEDRESQIDELTREYDSKSQEFFKASLPAEMTTAEKIRRYEAWPGWDYLPRFVKLAEETPDDEAAYRSCRWILDRTLNVGNEDKRIFDADQKVWQILGAHHTDRADLPLICLLAAEYVGPERQRFLRGLLERTDLSRENRGFATLALAELMSRQCDFCEGPFAAGHAAPLDEFEQYIVKQKTAEWGQDIIPANAPKFRTESIVLFREVLSNYADVPVTISAPGTGIRGLKRLSDKASKSLHALEHLTIGSEAPNIVGTDLHNQPLDLKDYRGKVVVLSFWFTGCGPCIGIVPEEQQLVEKYKDQSFALLGVSTDNDIEQSKTTVDEHNMNWPCWFDGENGPIARDWNILSFPMIYVLDERGVIVAKDIRGKDLAAKIDELIGGKKVESSGNSRE
jgi:thiol-disulfide isomerase/thioredoxin